MRRYPQLRGVKTYQPDEAVAAIMFILRLQSNVRRAAHEGDQLQELLPRSKALLPARDCNADQTDAGEQLPQLLQLRSAAGIIRVKYQYSLAHRPARHAML